VPRVVRTILDRIKAHNAVIMAAGIAFYATLALVPALLALVSVYAIVTEPAQIADQIDSLASNMDQETADLIAEQLATAVAEAKDSGSIALTIGILLALFSTSGAVQKLMLSINLAYGAIERRKGWKVRGRAYLFTAGAIVGSAGTVFLLGALPRVMDELGLSGPTQTVLGILRFPLVALAFGGALTILYRFGPDRSPRTAWRNPGALVGTLAFGLFTGLFALYFQLVGGMPASYGILGSIAAIIIYFQLCAIAVIIGAEVNATAEGSATLPFSPDAIGQDQGDTRPVEPVEPFGLGKALAGLAAIFILGRSRR
jgi:membrane protein